MTNRITQRIQIRFRDTDAMGHVNNAVYFTYFETARGRLFKELFKDKEQLQNLPIIVASNSCDYLKPLFVGTNIIAQCYVSRMGDKSFTITTKILDEDGTVYASGKTVAVFYDYKHSRSIRIPEQYRTVLKRFFVDE